MDNFELFLSGWQGFRLADGRERNDYVFGQCPCCGRSPSLVIPRMLAGDVMVQYFYCDPCDVNYSFHWLPEPSTSNPEAFLYQLNACDDCAAADDKSYDPDDDFDSLFGDV